MKTKNMLAQIAVVSAFALTAQAASAQMTGFYVEGTAGFGKFDLGNTSGWSVDNTDNNWGLTVGYMLNKYVGLEAGYRDLGSASGSIAGTLNGTLYGRPATLTGTLNASGDADGWLFGVRGVLPINDKFSLNGRLGWYDWKADLKATANAVLTWGGTAYPANATVTQSVDGNDMYYGIGATYNINKQLGVGIGYMQFDLDDIGVKNQTWDINLMYKF